MDLFVSDRFKARKVVGGAVIIAKDGEILYSYDYGHKTNSRREAVTLDSCFRIASVTKLVSAVGLMKLLEEKDIPLDTPVKDIVGYPVVNPSFPQDDITIRQVMSHTSSFVQTQYYHPTWETLKTDNKYFSQTVRPGTEYAYSNLNGGLFGAMIEALSGQSVNTYMQENMEGIRYIDAYNRIRSNFGSPDGIHFDRATYQEIYRIIRFHLYCGWYTENGLWFWFENGEPRTGWQYLDNSWQYFDGNGVRWIRDGRVGEVVLAPYPETGMLDPYQGIYH